MEIQDLMGDIQVPVISSPLEVLVGEEEDTHQLPRIGMGIRDRMVIVPDSLQQPDLRQEMLSEVPEESGEEPEVEVPPHHALALEVTVPMAM